MDKQLPSLIKLFSVNRNRTMRLGLSSLAACSPPKGRRRRIKKRHTNHSESTWELFHVICYYQYISCRGTDSRYDRDKRPQVFLRIKYYWSCFEELRFELDALKQLQRTIRGGWETGILPTLFWTTWFSTFTTILSNYTKHFEKQSKLEPPLSSLPYLNKNLSLTNCSVARWG